MNSKDLSDEHIIPRALGGCLYARFLCKTCNDNFGRQIEAKAKSDPAVQVAVENLEKQMPELARRITEHQAYLLKGPGGNALAYLKNGKLCVRSAKQPDGSIIQSTSDGCDHIEAALRKRGASNEEVSEKLEQFDNAPENEPITLGAGLRAIKRQSKSVYPALDGNLIGPLLPLKIAFEFLAAHIGDRIYRDIPQLNEIREVLRGEKAMSRSHVVERLGTRIYRPVHGLALDFAEPHIVISICLFGQLRFQVEFLDIAWRGPQYVYTCELASGEEWVEEIKKPT